MFTSYFLQEELVEELEHLFQDMGFPDKDGNLQKMNVYKQFLPVRESGRMGDKQEDLENGLPDDELDQIPFPYIQVILEGGSVYTDGRSSTDYVLLYIGVRDDGKLRNGYGWVLTIIQKICERFGKDMLLGNYRCGEKIDWEISGNDEHPCYFGAMEMTFERLTMNKEDRYT